MSSRAERVLNDRDIRRIEHSLELVFFIERRGERHYLIVAVGRCADYQLRALTAGGEARRVLISDKLCRALFYLICNKSHRAEYRLLCFVRRESLQAVVRRQFDIDVILSASIPRRVISALSAPGIALAWIYPPNLYSSRRMRRVSIIRSQV